jgi:hypothetical protein
MSSHLRTLVETLSQENMSHTIEANDGHALHTCQHNRVRQEAEDAGRNATAAHELTLELANVASLQLWTMIAGGIRHCGAAELRRSAHKRRKHA